MARKVSRGPMHSSVSSNHLSSPMIVMSVSWLHSESARAYQNIAPSNTLLYVYLMKSVLKHRLLVMARPANSSSLLQLVAEVHKLWNLSVCRE